MSWWGGSPNFLLHSRFFLTGFVLGIVFLTIGIFWMWYEQTYVVIFNFEMIGEIWCIIGFLVGFIFTSKSDAPDKILTNIFIILSIFFLSNKPSRTPMLTGNEILSKLSFGIIIITPQDCV